MKSLLFILLIFNIDLSASAEEIQTANGVPKLPPKSSPGFAILGALGLFPSNATKITYGGWITPGSNGGIEQHRFTAQVPVYQDEHDNFSLSAGGTSLHFGDSETLSGSGTVVPQSLWKLEVGGSYSRQLENEKFEGVRLSFGSASNRPFDGLGVTTLGASAYYSWPGSESSRWVLTVFFSNNNPLLNYIPIPGFIYLIQNETFIGMFGFPLTTMIWTPLKPWMFTLSIFGPTVISEIAVGNPRKIQVYTGYNYLQQTFLRQDRSDADARIYFNEMHIPVGVKFPVAGLKCDLSAGYAFDRSIYEGTKFGKRDGGNVDLGHSWFAAWNLGLDL